jgi:hypothetical protein
VFEIQSDDLGPAKAYIQGLDASFGYHLIQFKLLWQAASGQISDIKKELQAECERVGIQADIYVEGT